MEGDQRVHTVIRSRPPISIHALRVEGDVGREGGNQLQRQISIHALRVEGDPHYGARGDARGGISIHALRVEGDGIKKAVKDVAKDFYPRPPGGGRPELSVVPDLPDFISIHALRVEGDQRHDQSTGSGRDISIHALRVEGDIKAHGEVSTYCISIHALRVEGDLSPIRPFTMRPYFYPRPPGGGRQINTRSGAARMTFLSTPSGWRATSSLHA